MTLNVRKITVMIVADHPIMRDGLRLRVEQEADMDVICETVDQASVLTDFTRCCPDVTIIDLQKPRGAGLRAVASICQVAPHSAIVVLTTYPWEAKLPLRSEEGLVLRISKTAPGDDIIAAVRQAAFFDDRSA